jgi:nitroreductase
MSDTSKALAQALGERFGEAFSIPEGLPNLDRLLNIASYTSHRSWSEQALDPALLRLLVACALSAPSKSYLQQADVIEVRDPVQRKAVEELVPSMPWMGSAPALLVFCGNGRRFRRLFAARGQPFTNEHLDGFFNPVVDAALVMMNFIQASASVGLVCCPISVLRDQAVRLAEILEIPDHVVPIAGLCVGYPSQTRSINPRLSLTATLHVDRFDDQASDSRIKDFDERYVSARAAVLKGSGVGPKAPSSAPSPSTWSEEKIKQYGQGQRKDWGTFVKSKKFDLS